MSLYTWFQDHWPSAMKFAWSRPGCKPNSTLIKLSHLHGDAGQSCSHVCGS